MLGYPDIAPPPDAVPADRRARADRAGGRRPLPGPRPAAQGHEPRGARGAARGHRLPDGAVRRGRRPRRPTATRRDDARGRRGSASMPPTSRSSTTRSSEHELWTVRESGLGATAHVPDRPDTFQGWEDSAVPVDRLGDYLRDLRAALRGVRLRQRHRPLASTATSARAACTPGSRSTLPAPRASRPTAGSSSGPPTSSSPYGGSLSGEHGDGQSRGELLPKMFGEEVVGPLRAGSRRSSTPTT